MNISNLSNQIEIAFWMGIVSLLRPRRYTRHISFALLFLLCLVAVLLTAFTFVIEARTTRVTRAKIGGCPHGSLILADQIMARKISLLILVDQVDATEPGLQGVWMLIHDPSGKKVYFMPIYPARIEVWPGCEAVCWDGKNQRFIAWN